MHQVYIVLPGTHVGGAQKRFVELWDGFQSMGYSNVHLVLTRTLFHHLEELPYLRHFRFDNPAIHLVRARRERELYPQIARLIWRAPRKTVFHYPLGGFPLLHRLLGHRVVKSYTNNSYFEGEHRRVLFRTLFWATALTADVIDVLNPHVYEKFRQHPLVRGRVRTGGGSFVDLETFRPDSEKRNWITFLGRLPQDDEKNMLRLLACLPAVHRMLIEKGHQVEYHLLGHGALESQVRGVLARPEYQELPVVFRFHPNPLEVLRHSKVFLSLQKSSNYPSKSLLEATACGALPVVTDVGESRSIATDDFAQFIPGEFDAGDLGGAILNILEQPPEVIAERCRRGREFLRQNFSISTQLDYFLSLYNLERGHPNTAVRAGTE